MVVTHLHSHWDAHTRRNITTQIIINNALCWSLFIQDLRIGLGHVLTSKNLSHVAICFFVFFVEDDSPNPTGMLISLAQWVITCNNHMISLHMG